MSLTLAIRPATPADLSRVDALLARAYPRLLKPDYPPSVLVTIVPRLARAQPALLASGTYFVAEAAGGAILGAGGWTPGVRPGRGELRHLVTDDRHTRRGIARRLVETALGSARDAGIEALDCLATRTAVPFYRAMGFAPLGPVEVPFFAGAIAFRAERMVVRLTP